jgi:hypothetical protein
MVLCVFVFLLFVVGFWGLCGGLLIMVVFMEVIVFLFVFIVILVVVVMVVG